VLLIAIIVRETCLGGSSTRIAKCGGEVATEPGPYPGVLDGASCGRRLRSIALASRSRVPKSRCYFATFCWLPATRRRLDCHNYRTQSSLCGEVPHGEGWVVISYWSVASAIRTTFIRRSHLAILPLLWRETCSFFVHLTHFSSPKGLVTPLRNESGRWPSRNGNSGRAKARCVQYVP
jgi:hypothetical protein